MPAAASRTAIKNAAGENAADWTPRELRHSWPLITGLVVLAAAGWLGSLYMWPYTRCRWCTGSGRNSGSTGRRYGKCRFCKGQPERLRFGARLVHRRGRG